MDTSFLNSIIKWLDFYPECAYLLIFIFSFLESLVLVGLVFPGIVIMTVVGILVGSQILPLTPVVIIATAGSFSGDYLSYGIGRYYHQSLKNIWPFNIFPNLIAKGETFFHKHGGKSVFIGRFVGPLRAIIPVIAGSLKLSNLRFLIADISGSLIWAIIYLLPGIIIGAASLALPHDAAKRIITDIVIALLLIFIAYWLLQISVIKITGLLDKSLCYFWGFLQRHPRGRFLFKLLKVSHIPQDHSQLWLAIFAIISWILLIVLAISVSKHLGIYYINDPLQYFFRSAYSLTMQKIMLCITYIGQPKTLLIFWLIILCWLALRRFWFTAIHWLLVGLLTLGILDILKLWIAFPRPLGLAKIPEGFSFPSGHTTMATALFSFLAIILVRNRDQYLAWFVYLLTGALCLLVGISRLYLGAHWCTDVLAAFALGLAVSLSIAVSFRRYPIQEKKSFELFIVAFLSISLLWLYTYHHLYKENLQSFTPVWPSTYISESYWWQHGIPNNPLIRKNRLGKNIQTLNVEWLGTLQAIKQQLTQQGWKSDTKSLLLHTIIYFGEKNYHKVLPLFSGIYQNKKPILLMSKLISENDSLLILYLWESHVIVVKQSAKTLPLWVGNVSYSYPDKFHLFSKYKKFNKIKPIQPFALDILMQDLGSSTMKLLNFPEVQRPPSIEDMGWQRKVLLIKTQNSGQ